MAGVVGIYPCAFSTNTLLGRAVTKLMPLVAIRSLLSLTSLFLSGEHEVPSPELLGDSVSALVLLEVCVLFVSR